MRVFDHGERRVYRTDLAAMCATWEIGADNVPRVLFVTDYTTATPAYRWPDTPLPACRTGHIAFGPHHPTLAQVIELLPRYETTLWEHLRMEFAAAQEAAAGDLTHHDAGTPAEREPAWQRVDRS